MLTELELQTFKCFPSLRLPLAPLTLLSGRNSSGKSSIMQALVLLHQTAVEAEWSDELRLNGPMVALGTAADVIDKVSGRYSFGIGLSTEAARVRWVFACEDRGALGLPVASTELSVPGGDGVRIEPGEPKRFLLPRPDPRLPCDPSPLAHKLCALQYVSAERTGPRETYVLGNPGLREVGVRGEHVPSLVYWLGDERVREPLLVPDEPPTLRRQAEAWMRAFFPGCSLDVQLVPMANQLTLALRTGGHTSFHRPQHVGFGLTQTLPVVVAPLVAREGDTLLVENPEIHLHPSGQAQIGRFLAQVAASGVQVIVETHSDHVLNGVRRAVRDRLLAPEQLAVHFLDRQEGAASSTLTSPRIDARGRVDQWPPGFFDQLDQDLMELADWEAPT